MVSRRTFLSGSGAALLGAALVSKAGAASLPEAPTMATYSPGAMARAARPNGKPHEVRGTPEGMGRTAKRCPFL